MSIGKAAGPDGLIAEMFTAMGDFGVTQITLIANRIYNESHFPTEMIKSIFIAIYQRSLERQDVISFER